MSDMGIGQAESGASEGKAGCDRRAAVLRSRRQVSDENARSVPPNQVSPQHPVQTCCTGARRRDELDSHKGVLRRIPQEIRESSAKTARHAHRVRRL